MEEVRFDENLDEEVEKAGKMIIKSYIECRYCRNKSIFSVLSKYQNSSIYRKGDVVHWQANYFYLISCPICKGIHLCKFRFSSESDLMCDQLFNDKEYCKSEGFCYQEIDLLGISELEIIYPLYKCSDLVSDKDIESISPQFIKIYNQAKIAEQIKLYEICGMAYRKSLEFLIKDFAIYKNPNDKGKISANKYFLSNCIKDYYNKMPNVKKCAERASWIGNDETHYTRIWEDKDINDLKILIEIVIYGIKADILEKKYTSEMKKKN